jgi:acyl-CoA reductase-like NAD-dependent aldehyde dehydrogenase
MRDVHLLIGGKSVAAGNAATFVRTNPISGSGVTRAAAATLSDADAAVAAASAAFPAWSTLAPSERRARLLKAADLMEQRTPDFIGAGMEETASIPGWYGFNVMLAVGMLREAASMITQISGEAIPSNVPGSLALAVRQPCGVVLGIAPWNAPVILGTRAISVPLACGNTVVLKASELCPALHVMIGQVLQDAGLGDGVVNVITNAPADAAVDAAAFGAFFNQGQICMSTERLVVDESIADSFVAKLAKKAASLKAGDPAGPTVHDEAQMPFGGVKSSGYGRFGGKAAIDEFTDLRWITIQTGPRHYPI